MRSTSLGLEGLAGGMRGAKTHELTTVAPRPTLATILVVNACRLLGWLLCGLARHPAIALTTLTLFALWRLLGTPGFVVLQVVALAGLIAWRLVHPGSFRRVLVSRWRAVAVYRRCWQPAMVTCGLAADVNGREYLPRIRRVRSTACMDRVLVELLSGQAPEDFERCTVQLAHTFKALRCRVIVDRPGRVMVEFTHTDPLTQPVPALLPESVPDFGALAIGRREDGTPWRLRLLGTHVLVAGATGSGKGSVVWSLIRALGPCIRDGSVHVWAVDPKGGMELTPGAALFSRFAYESAAAMVELLEDAVALMRQRAERLRLAGSRVHVPTIQDPLVVVVIDELAALTAYLGDRDLKRRAEAALQLLLSQGRAPGVLLVAAVQDPGKDVVGFRDLFPSRIALRLLEDVQVDMVLGRSARQHGAECDQIPASLPGVGYVVLEGVREPVRVRAAYVDDGDLAKMVEDYSPLSRDVARYLAAVDGD
jgi:S-DNA-T family DNA segregation ATPase FtsK/SpoIIIE